MPPVISSLDGDSTNLAIDDAAYIDKPVPVSVTDSDSVDFNGGYLLIHQADGIKDGEFWGDATGDNSLKFGNDIDTADDVIADGETVFSNSTAIGWVDSVEGANGQSGADLRIDLDSAANAQNMSELLAALRYYAPTAGLRTFEVNLDDGDGGTSNAITFAMNFVEPDIAAPALLAIQRTAAEATNAATLAYTLVFSEVVTNVDASDFTVSTTGTATGSVTDVTGSGNTRMVTVATVDGTGKLGLSLNNGHGITDSAGNALPNGNPADNEAYTVDRSVPTLLSLNRLNSGDATTNADSVQFLAVFSEQVSGIAAGDFALTGLATTGASITSVSGDGSSVITITVGSVNGNGTLGVALAASPTITDAIGNGMTNFSPTSTVAESYTIDNSAPTAVSMLRNAAELTTDGSVTFDVVFSEGLHNVSADDFVVTGGATGAIASVTGSGSAYTVTVSSVAGEGVLGLSYAGAQNISDAGGNAFAGALPLRNESYTVDNTAPSVTAINRAGVNQIAASTATNAVFTVVFSEHVTDVAADDFTVTGDASYGSVSVSSADGKVFQVTVADVNGTVGQTLGLSFTGSINDVLSQTGSAQFTTGQTYTIGGVLLNEGPIDQAGLDTLAGANHNGTLQLVDAVGTASEVVILDSRLPGLVTLMDSVTSSTDVWLLDAGSSALGQISALLGQYGGLSAVHLLSHGSAGEIYPGAETISFGTLASQSATLSAWGHALSDTGDLLVYGCNVGAGETGQHFIEALATATGADVAASDDLTGSSWLGGDWELEANAGVVESGEVVTNDSYQHVMTSVPGGGGGDTIAPTFDVTPSAGSASTTGFTPSASIDEAGTVYYVVVANNDSAPSVVQVIAGQNATGAAALKSGSSAVTTTPFTSNFSAVTGLIASTAYDVYFVAADDESTPNKMVSVTKVDVTTSAPSNTSPEFTSDANNNGTHDTGLTVNENATATDIATLLGVTDTDSGQTLTWSVVSGQGPSYGTLLGFGTNPTATSGTGVTPSSVTYTPTADYSGTDSFQIQVSDGNGGTDTLIITVTVTDVNPVISNATFSVDENSSNTTAVGTVTATGDTDGLIYSITGGNTGNVFAINSSTGEITVAGALNYEATSSYSLTVAVDDEDADINADSTATITVNINNVVEAPLLKSSSPLDNVTGVAVTSNVVLTFDEDVQLGTSGTMTLYDITGAGANSITFDVANHASQLSITGKTLTIDPTASLMTTNQYAVQFTAGALKGTTDLECAAISDTTTLNFTTGTIDTTTPTVTIVDVTDPTQPNAGTVNITFSEQVLNVDISDVTLTCDTGSGAQSVSLTGLSVSGSGSSYTLDLSTVTVTAGTYVLTLNTSNITDTTGNALVAGASDTFVIDSTEPTGVALLRASANPATASSVNFTMAFSEAVTGVDAGDFMLTGTAASGTSIGTVTKISDSVYSVAVNTITGDGTLGLDLKSSGTGITDVAGNAISGGVTGQLYTIDNTAPTVTAINRNDAAIISGASASFTVSFSETVTGVDASDFVLTGTATSGAGIGTVTKLSDNVYTVAVTSISGNGTLALDLKSSGTDIADHAGNAIATGFTTGDVYTIDTTNPTVTASQAFNLPENMSNGFVIGQVQASDTSGVVMYTIESGDTDAFFAIDAYGVITLTSAGSAAKVASSDYETQPNTFTLGIKAVDAAGNTSSSETVTITVLDEVENSKPTLTAIGNVTGGTEDTQQEITFTALKDLADEADTDGTVDAFVVKAVSTGALKIGAAAASATAWDASTNAVVDSTHHAYWTPSSNANGNLNAFTIVAMDDGGAKSITPVQVVVETAAVNDAPTDIALTANSVNQSAAIASATVATISGTDPESDTLTFTLVSGTGDTNNSSFSIDGTSLKVGTSELSAGTYSLLIRATDNGTGNLTYDEQVIITVADDVAPTLSSSTPADNATAIAPGADIVLAFNENIAAGTGNITLVNVSTGATVETFNIAVIGGANGDHGGNASISGTTLTINPGSTLAEATQYAVQIGTTAVTDTANNVFGGIADNSTLNFTTGVTDNTAPALLAIQRTAAEATNAATLTCTLVFSEAVTNVDASDFAVSTTGTATGSVTSVTGSGNTRTVTVATVDGTGKLGLSLNNGHGITDSAGNALPNGNPVDNEAYTVDRTVPTLLSLNRINSGDATTNADSVQFIAVFSEPVSGIAAGDFALTGTATTGASITSVSGNGSSVITITVGSISGDGTLGVALAASPTITDTIGNGLTNFSPTSTVAESYTMDNGAPTAVSILRNAAELTTDGSVTFDVVFNESVHNVSADDFAVTGAATGTIASVTGTGSAYTVTVSSVAGEGALGLSYAGAQNISDAGGNAFAGALPLRNESYTVDNTAPSVTAINRTGVNQIAASTATNAVFTVVFNEPVSGVAVADFTVTGDASHGAVSVISADGKVFQVTVADVNGTVGQTLGLSFTGSVNDALSQTGSAQFTTGQTYTIGGILLNEGAIDQAGLDTLAGANHSGMLHLVDAAGTASEVVILDSRLPGMATLMNDVHAGTDVWLLDAGSSALGQIRGILGQYHNLNAVHLLSHGSTGEIYLGAETISAGTLASQSATLSEWGHALSDTGDLLVYGCNIGAGETGLHFIEALATATGADVAASDDLTGSSWLGGDWVLESKAGVVDAHTIALQNYEGTLESASLVKDIYSGSSGSSPSSLTDVNGVLFFIATDGINGNELWKSDGTADGTVMVKDIASGSSGSYLGSLTNVNGTLYFRAYDDVNGSELWKSDGTADGTVMVKDINSGSGSSSPSSLTNINGTLYFSANDGVNGSELWKSDGTADGTVMVKDINSGSGSSSPSSLANINGTLYFAATDGVNGSELWKSDGTAAGTVMVKNIYSAYGGSSGSNPTLFTEVNGTVYFSASDGTNGAELWKSDGTTDGTVMVKNIRINSADSSPSSLTNINGTLFFSAVENTNGRELWKSDGTEAGTVMVKDIKSGVGSSSPISFTNVNGTLYFSAYNGDLGIELCKSDGTTDGTVMVKDISSGISSSSPSSLTNVNGTWYFSANNGIDGTQIWKSDGTADGTVMVSGSSTSYTSSLINVNGTLYFTASNGTNGNELYQLTDNAVPAFTGDADNNGTHDTGITLNENATATDIATLLGVTDTDSGQTLTWSVVSGQGPGHGTLLGFGTNPTATSGTGVTPSSVTYTPTADYSGTDSFRIQVSDGNGGTDTLIITVTVTDVNPVISNATFSVDENSSNTTAVGTVTATGDTDGLIYSITGGNTGNIFAINSTTGAITVAGALNYEATSSYSLTVAVDDEDADTTADSTATITVNINNVVDAPVLQSASPLDNITGVAVTSNVLLTFDQDVQFGSGGAITLYDITGAGANSITIDVSNHASQLSITGKTLTIDPTASLITTTQYAVQFTAGALKGTTNLECAAISDTTTLNFTTGTIDTTAPTVTIVDVTDPTQPNAGTVNITFSEQVLNVDISDVTLTCDTGSGAQSVSLTGLSVSGSGSSYTLDLSTVTATAGTYVLRLNTSNITDTTGNALAAGASDTFVINRMAPTGLALVRASAENPTDAVSVIFTMAFSEAVTGVDAGDFTLTGTASSGASIGTVTKISDSVYSVAVNTITGDGTLGLDLKSSGTAITDIAGNAISGGVTGQLYTIDNTAPTVTAINRNDAAIISGGSTSFTVSFSEAVTGVDASDFTRDLSGVTTTNDDSDISVTGSGSVYTVTVANVSGTGTLSVDLKSTGTGIADVAGNAIATGFTTGDVYTIDTTNPTVTASQAFNLPENMSNGFVIGQVQASDTNGVVMYTIESGDTSGYFAIDSYGVLTLTPAGSAAKVASSDYETLPNTFTLGIKAVDAAGNTSSSEMVTITVLDEVENRAPVAVADTVTAGEAGGIANGTAGIDPTGNVLTNDTDSDAGDTRSIIDILAGTTGAGTAVSVGSTSISSGTTVTGTYGSLVIGANGSYVYTVDNSNSTVQALSGVAQTLADTFTYTVQDAGGLSDSTTLTVTITGSNDAALITGTSTASVTEGNLATDLSAGGTLTSTDVDGTANLFTAQTNVAGSNGYGKFSITTAGAWSYTADSAHNEFVGGTSYTDSITVAAADGTTQNLTVTITGTNDLPAISGTSTGAVTEDTSVTNNHITTSGTLTIIDPDQNQSSFVAQPSHAGTYGTFTLDAIGNWSYSADNTQAVVQQLGVTQSLTDSFTAVSLDGSASQTVTVTINGTTDAFVSVGSTTVNEAAGTATFTVTRSDDTHGAITVDYATQAGSALAGSDYTATSGTLRFANGATTRQVTVPLVNDTLFEGTESFSIQLSNPSTWVTLSNQPGVATIKDDGTGSGGTDNDTPTLSVSHVTLSESSPYALFAVNIDHASTQAVSFTPGLHSGTATVGTDTDTILEYFDGTVWQNATGAITINAGATNVVLRVEIANDSTYEGAETFTLLADSLTGTLTNTTAAEGSVTIVDNGSGANIFMDGNTSTSPTKGTANDDRPIISISNSTVSEAQPYATVSVSLSNPSTTAVGFTPSLVSNTAILGVDFGSSLEYFNGTNWAAVSGSIAIPAGSLSVQLRTTLVQDSLFTEGIERFQITTGAIQGDVVNQSGTSGTVSITDVQQLSDPVIIDTTEIASDPNPYDLLTADKSPQLTLNGEAGCTVALYQKSGGQYTEINTVAFTTTEQSGTYTLDFGNNALAHGDYAVQLTKGGYTSNYSNIFTIDSTPELYDITGQREIVMRSATDAVTQGVVGGMDQNRQPGFWNGTNWVDSDGETVRFSFDTLSIFDQFSLPTGTVIKTLANGSTLKLNVQTGAYVYNPVNTATLAQFTLYVSDGKQGSSLELTFDAKDTLDRDGISSVVENGLATLAATVNGVNSSIDLNHDGDITNDGDLNHDGIADASQNAVATLAWITAENFDAAKAAENSGDFSALKTESVISLAIVDSTSGDTVDATSQLRDVKVMDAADTVALTGGSKPAGTDWDPIQFTVEALQSSGFIDADPSRPGTQVRLLIDISRAGQVAGSFIGYEKYVSQATIDKAIVLGTPLHDLDDHPITVSGWFDFMQRTAGGDGARFITSNGMITAIELTLTDNSFGDNDMGYGRISDPGVPLTLSATKLDTADQTPGQVDFYGSTIAGSRPLHTWYNPVTGDYFYGVDAAQVPYSCYVQQEDLGTVLLAGTGVYDVHLYLNSAGDTQLVGESTANARGLLAQGYTDMGTLFASARAVTLDTVAPTVDIFSPTDNATKAPVANDIVLTFSEEITKGSTGTIAIHSGSATGPVVASSLDATSARITASGKTLTINPTDDLVHDTHYFVTLDDGSVVDLAGNNYAGTSNYDFWTDSLGADPYAGGGSSDVGTGAVLGGIAALGVIAWLAF